MAKRCSKSNPCVRPASRFGKKALGVDWYDHNNVTPGPEPDPLTVILTSNAGSPEAGVFTLTITFSEPTIGFKLHHLEISGGIQNTLQTSNNSVYTCEIIPEYDGDILIQIPAGTISNNEASNLLSVSVFDPADISSIRFGLESFGAKNLNFSQDPRTVKTITDIAGNVTPTAPGSDWQTQPFYDKKGRYIGINGEGKRLELTSDMSEFSSDQQGELVFLYQKQATNA